MNIKKKYLEYAGFVIPILLAVLCLISATLGFYSYQHLKFSDKAMVLRNGKNESRSKRRLCS